jgi:NADPH:quinone reductase-like Zn-dependent oxidoreductase
MRAIAIADFAAPPALRDLPTPDPGWGEVLVRVQASSLNGFDVAVAGGGLKGMMEHRFPVVLGRDFAGEVEATGAGAFRFRAGDPVFGVVAKPVLGDGSFCECLTVAEDAGVARIPEGLDRQTAGALGLAGTAALMCVDAVAPAAGEAVLICGATGGVGACAVQLAADCGAEVIATAQPGVEADFVRRLGATITVDYGSDLAEQVRTVRPDGVDGVIHLVGDGLQLADLLVPGGRMASTLGLGPQQLADRPIVATSIVASPTAALLERLAADAAAGRLRVPVQRSYRLEQVPEAIADFATGTLGKLAITIG